MGPIGSATSDAGSASKKHRKLQENVEMLGMYHRLRYAAAVAHFKINESRVRTIVKKQKEIHEAITAAMPAGAKTSHVW